MIIRPSTFAKRSQFLQVLRTQPRAQYRLNYPFLVLNSLSNVDIIPYGLNVLWQ